MILILIDMIFDPAYQNIYLDLDFFCWPRDLDIVLCSFVVPNIAGFGRKPPDHILNLIPLIFFPLTYTCTHSFTKLLTLIPIEVDLWMPDLLKQ